LTRANARTEEQRRLAETNFHKARQAVDEYFTKVSESKLLNVPGLQPLRKELLESARRYYEQFLRDRGTDRTVRAEAAEAWYRLGSVAKEVSTPEEAAEDFEGAVAMYEALAREHPHEPRYSSKVAMALNELGNQQARLGQSIEALRTEERSLEIRRRVADENPGVAEYQKELGTGLMNCSAGLSRTGRMEEAIPLCQEARGVYERLLQEYPDVPEYRSRLAAVFEELAYIHDNSGRSDEALGNLDKALRLREQVVRDDPHSIAFQYSHAITLRFIGQIYQRRTRRHAEAIPYYRRAIEDLERLARENPDVRTYPLQLAYAYCYLGQVQSGSGRPAEARAVSRKALALFERIDRDVLANHYDLACIRSLSSDLVRLDKNDAAAAEQSRRLADRAMDALRQAVAGGFRDVAWIEKDPDLAPLRSRDDYKALIAGLKARNEAPPRTLTR
jgi:serine/threonine-protein kinase